ncbi:MAG: GTP cyclohydrolase MptA [Thermoplasmatota archaeon]
MGERGGGARGARAGARGRVARRAAGAGESDVQSRRTPRGYMLGRVGVKGIKKPVRVRRPGRVVTLHPVMSVFVDLPATQRGSHMSRNVEVVAEVVEASVSRPCAGLEDLAAEMVRGLLRRHDYATFAEVEMESDYFLERRNPSGKSTMESYGLVARAVAHRGAVPLVRKSIGVKVTGMTACPCAQETVRRLMARRSGGRRARASAPSLLTHNQRNLTTLIMEVPESFSVEADDLIEIVESSQSSPTYEILKRPDEGRIVLNSHLNPKFVEDVVREILEKVVVRYRELPDETAVTVHTESQESIHKHDAVAERVTTLGELRRAMPPAPGRGRSCP